MNDSDCCRGKLLNSCALTQIGIKATFRNINGIIKRQSASYTFRINMSNATGKAQN